MNRILNMGCGPDIDYGTDLLDKHPQSKKVKRFDFNDATRLPYKDNTFSEVRLRQVIQFMLYPQEILEECNRVLMRGGKLNLETQNGASISFCIRPMGMKYVKGKGNWGYEHIHSIYNIYTLKEALELAGFSVKEIKTYRGSIKYGLLQAFFKRGLRVVAIKR